MKKTLYFDLIGGAAGDMLLASLIDLGVSLEPIQKALAGLGLHRVQLESTQVKPAGLCARRLDVIIDGHLADTEVSKEQSHHHEHRPYKKIKDILETATLDIEVKEIALRAFRLLAEAEAKAHGVEIEEVEFHEVGSDDAIADIVGTAAAVNALSVDEIVVSPVPLGRGLTKGAHGPIPLPAPATLFILQDTPVLETQLNGELVTPTGAALLCALADRFGPIPSMTLRKIGLGAGRKEWPDRPNIVRALLGDATDSSIVSSDDELVIETNIDDMTPEQLASLEEALRASGAFDVWRTSIGMKKNRTGQMISVLLRRSSVDAVVETFFTHSTTLGLRQYPVRRHRAERRLETITTKYGEVQLKISVRKDGSNLCMPEFDDWARLAKINSTSVLVVQEAALQAFHEKTDKD